MPRYLGIDYGDKRIGLAVSDAEARLASPLRQLEHGTAGDVLSALRKVIDDYSINALVIGLPLNMDGSEGQQARKTRRFGQKLADALSLPVDYQYERLSTYAAERLLDTRDELTAKKRRARRDALAALTFLQAFLDHRHAQDR